MTRQPIQTMNKEQIKDDQIRRETNDWQYQMDETKRELINILKITRETPGLQIRTIAEAIKDVFDKFEVNSLIKQLK